MDSIYIYTHIHTWIYGYRYVCMYICIRYVHTHTKRAHTIAWLPYTQSLETALMDIWHEDRRSYPQKTGTGMEPEVKYLALRVWRPLPGTGQRGCLLLVVWNLSRHQNYLQIPAIKKKSTYESRLWKLKQGAFTHSFGTPCHDFIQFIFTSSKKHK